MCLGQLVSQLLLVGVEQGEGVGLHVLLQGQQGVFCQVFYLFYFLVLCGEALAYVVTGTQGGVPDLLAYRRNTLCQYLAFFA